MRQDRGTSVPSCNEGSGVQGSGQTQTQGSICWGRGLLA